MALQGRFKTRGFTGTMRILIVHNFYQQPGGEDAVFAAETAMLESAGHTVVTHTCSNTELNSWSGINKAVRTVWNCNTIGPIEQLIRAHSIDVVHFHNTFQVLSPAVYYAAKRCGIPVVQTLHNFRLICLNAMLFRDGAICNDCVTRRSFLPGVYHACYRNSIAASAVTAAMLNIHRWLRTWDNIIDTYIVLTDFAKQQFVSAGLPADKLQIKPNFVHPDPGPGAGAGNYALFVGRLTPEKGVETLLAAWKQVSYGFGLKVVGDGPLAPLVISTSRDNSNIEWLGHRSKADVYRLIGDAKFLVFPSRWYEGMPLVVLEAFARGTPVVSSNIGSVASMNINNVTGYHFEAGCVDCLASTVCSILDNPGPLASMRINARAEFEAKYSIAQNLTALVDIYRDASTTTIASARAVGTPDPG